MIGVIRQIAGSGWLAIAGGIVLGGMLVAGVMRERNADQAARLAREASHQARALVDLGMEAGDFRAEAVSNTALSTTQARGNSMEKAIERRIDLALEQAKIERAAVVRREVKPGRVMLKRAGGGSAKALASGQNVEASYVDVHIEVRTASAGVGLRFAQDLISAFDRCKVNELSVDRVAMGADTRAAFRLGLSVRVYASSMR